MLARGAQRLAAGRQDLDLGHAAEQLGGQGRGGLDDVLAVVEHDQHPAALRRGTRPEQQLDRTAVARRARPAGARSTNRTPCSQEPASCLATAIASVVLPMPPGPTTVTSRWFASCLRSVSRLSVRSIRRVIGAGRPDASADCRRGAARLSSSVRATGCDEPIAPTRHRRHVAAGIAVVAQGPAQARPSGPSGCSPRRRCRARPAPSARSCSRARRGARPARSGSRARGCPGAPGWRRGAAACAPGSDGTGRSRWPVRTGPRIRPRRRHPVSAWRSGASACGMDEPRPVEASRGW